MQKFFEGQTVKIKKLKDINNTGAFPTLVDEMRVYCGKKDKITRAAEHFRYNVFIYQLFGWSWREDWIEEDNFFDEKDFEI